MDLEKAKKDLAGMSEEAKALRETLTSHVTSHCSVREAIRRRLNEVLVRRQALKEIVYRAEGEAELGRVFQRIAGRPGTPTRYLIAPPKKGEIAV